MNEQHDHNLEHHDDHEQPMSTTENIVFARADSIHSVVANNSFPKRENPNEEPDCIVIHANKGELIISQKLLNQSHVESIF